MTNRLSLLLGTLSALIMFSSCDLESGGNYSGISVSTFELYNTTLTVKDGMVKDQGFYDSSFEYKGWTISSHADSTLLNIDEKIKPEMYPFAAYAKTRGIAPTIHEESKWFGVYQMTDAEEPSMTLIQPDKQSYTVSGVYVCNTLQTAIQVAQSFKEGDWLKLTARGWYAGNEKKAQEFYLADMRDVKEGEMCKIVSDWTHFDISKLGAIDKLQFEVSVSPGHEDLLLAFCMDTLYGTIAFSY